MRAGTPAERAPEPAQRLYPPYGAKETTAEDWRMRGSSFRAKINYKDMCRLLKSIPTSLFVNFIFDSFHFD